MYMSYELLKSTASLEHCALCVKAQVDDDCFHDENQARISVE